MSQVRLWDHLIIAGLSAWVLWTYNLPDPDYLVLAATETRDECVAYQHRLKGPAGISVSWQLRCLPIGVEPERVHGLYDLNMALPVVE